MQVNMNRPAFEVPSSVITVTDGHKIKIPLHLVPKSEIEPMLEEFCTKIRQYMAEFGKNDEVVERAVRSTQEDIKAGMTARVALMTNVSGLTQEDAALVIKLVEKWHNSSIL